MGFLGSLGLAPVPSDSAAVPNQRQSCEVCSSRRVSLGILEFIKEMHLFSQATRLSPLGAQCLSKFWIHDEKESEYDEYAIFWDGLRMYRHRIHELTSLWVRPPSFLRPTEILVFSLNLAAGDYLSGLTVAHKTGRAKRGYTHTIYSLSTPATI